MTVIPFLPYPVRRTYRAASNAGTRIATTAVRRAIELRGGCRVVVFLGMRRSGNHLVINWMKKQSDGPVVFYNNIKLNKEPFDHRCEFRVGGFGPSRMILSYEDLTPEKVLAGRLGAFLTRCTRERRGQATIVAILRDPYNHFASRAQRRPERLHDPEWRAVWRALYHCYADLFLAGSLPETALPEGLAGRLPLITISYNEFVASRPYREGVAERLGLRATDRGLDEVPRYGVGSSFDGFAESAAQLKVFDRWRSWRGDPDYQTLLDDPALLEKARRIFGRYMPDLN